MDSDLNYILKSVLAESWLNLLQFHLLKFISRGKVTILDFTV